MVALRTTIVTKTVNVPLNFVFDWCTDYQESDPAITGSNRKRVILDRSKKRVVFAALFDEYDGRTHVSVYDVKLKPQTVGITIFSTPTELELAITI